MGIYYLNKKIFYVKERIKTLRGHKNANYESKFTNEIRNCFGFNA